MREWLYCTSSILSLNNNQQEVECKKGKQWILLAPVYAKIWGVTTSGRVATPWDIFFILTRKHCYITVLVTMCNCGSTVLKTKGDKTQSHGWRSEYQMTTRKQPKESLSLLPPPPSLYSKLWIRKTRKERRKAAGDERSSLFSMTFFASGPSSRQGRKRVPHSILVHTHPTDTRASQARLNQQSSYSAIFRWGAKGVSEWVVS